jgi:hypothetical protein
MILIDTDFTGFQPPQAQSSFNAIAALGPQQTGMQQGGGGDKFAPSSIFSAMKRTDFGKPEEQQPQGPGACPGLD